MKVLMVTAVALVISAPIADPPKARGEERVLVMAKEPTLGCISDAALDKGLPILIAEAKKPEAKQKTGEMWKRLHSLGCTGVTPENGILNFVRTTSDHEYCAVQNRYGRVLWVMCMELRTPPEPRWRVERPWHRTPQRTE